MARSKHPAWEQILGAVESPARAPSEIQEHIRTCDDCAVVAEEARRILESLSAEQLPHPPRPLVEQTLAALSQRLRDREASASARLQEELRALAARLREGWQAAAAALIADSWRASPALRGSAGTGSRMLIYETDDFSIALSLTDDPDSTGRSLIGQVVPRQGTSLPPAGWVLVRQAPEVVGERLTDLGEFQLAGLAPEIIDLDLVLGDKHVSLHLPSGS